MKTLTAVYIIPLLVVSFIQCTSKKTVDAGSFYKVFSGKINNENMLIYLYRDTVNSTVAYNGYITDTATGALFSLSGYVPDSADASSLSWQIITAGDTSWNIRGSFNSDASEITGNVVKIKADTIRLDSSAVHFTLIKNNDHPFTYYSSNKKFHAAKSGYTGNYSMSFIWPQNWKDEQMMHVLQDTIASMLGIQSADKTDPMAAYMNTSEKDFNTTYADFDTTGFGGSEMQTENTGQVNLIYMNENFISMNYFTSHYESGMAHDQYGSGYYVFSLKNGKILSLKDILSPAAIQQLPALVNHYFRIDYHLSPTESLTNAGLFENKIAPNNNFYLTNKMLVFHYGNYEIAPFAAGEYEVHIPLQQLNGGLQL